MMCGASVNCNLIKMYIYLRNSYKKNPSAEKKNALFVSSVYVSGMEI